MIILFAMYLGYLDGRYGKFVIIEDTTIQN